MSLPSFTPSMLSGERKSHVQTSTARTLPPAYNLEDRLDAATNTTLLETLKALPQIQKSPSASKTKLSNTPTLRSWPSSDLINLCDPLGFIKGPVSTSTRQHLAQAINSCIDTPDGSPVGDGGNMSPSEELAWSFLKRYGSIFWGQINRKHLKEPDSSKGLLYDRDAERSVSRRSSFDPTCNRAYQEFGIRLSNALEMIFRDRLRFTERGEVSSMKRIHRVQADRSVPGSRVF